MAQPDDIQRMVAQALTHFHVIDILVNNAGIVLPFDLHAPDYDAWQRMVDVNIKGMLLSSCSNSGRRPTEAPGPQSAPGGRHSH